jgi:hypothetical protein
MMRVTLIMVPTPQKMYHVLGFICKRQYAVTVQVTIGVK